MAVQGVVLESCTELQKFIILSVHAEDDPIPDRARLQHIMFLHARVTDAVREQARFAFRDFGVYSRTVDEELDRLIGMGIISEGKYGIEATEEGRKVGRALRKKENVTDMATLCGRKHALNSITDDELFSSFCLQFPEYAAKFSRYEELKPHFEDHIFSILAKYEMGPGKAASLLNKDRIYVLKKMKKMGIVTLW